MSRSVLGVDTQSDTLRAVLATSDEGGTMSYRLLSHSLESGISENGLELSLAVPDDRAIVKRLRFEPEPDLPLEDQLCFELQTTLLDPADHFQFDYHKLPSDHEYLGIIYRRKVLTALRNDLSPEFVQKASSAEYHLRSIALGRGYLKFAAPTQAEPTVLIDIAPGMTSVCFLDKGEIAGVASLSMKGELPEEIQAVDEFMTDLRSVISLRLSTLTCADRFHNQYSLLVNHGRADDRLDLALEQMFGLSPKRMVIDPSLVPLAGSSSDKPMEEFLVGLGLVA